MARYFVELAYDGSAYHGWQVQPNASSVQGVINKALSTVLREQVVVVGCGRTDTGVHASFYVFHFDTVQCLDLGSLLYSLNGLLPTDIAIYKIYPVKEEQHARFQAISRKYHYHVCLRKNPFLKGRAYHIRQTLHFELMNEAAQSLLGRQDFTSFSKLHTDVKDNYCTVTQAEWIRIDECHWYFCIAANRFLRNMVRAIVGTLLEIGLSRMTIQEFKDVIASKDRCQAGMSVPAQGLFLVEVKYE